MPKPVRLTRFIAKMGGLDKGDRMWRSPRYDEIQIAGFGASQAAACPG